MIINDTHIDRTISGKLWTSIVLVLLQLHIIQTGFNTIKYSLCEVSGYISFYPFLNVGFFELHATKILMGANNTWCKELLSKITIICIWYETKNDFMITECQRSLIYFINHTFIKIGLYKNRNTTTYRYTHWYRLNIQ